MTVSPQPYFQHGSAVSRSSHVCCVTQQTASVCVCASVYVYACMQEKSAERGGAPSGSSRPCRRRSLSGPTCSGTQARTLSYVPSSLQMKNCHTYIYIHVRIYIHIYAYIYVYRYIRKLPSRAGNVSWTFSCTAHPVTELWHHRPSWRITEHHRCHGVNHVASQSGAHHGQ